MPPANKITAGSSTMTAPMNPLPRDSSSPSAAVLSGAAVSPSRTRNLRPHDFVEEATTAWWSAATARLSRSIHNSSSNAAAPGRKGRRHRPSRLGRTRRRHASGSGLLRLIKHACAE
ncbi:unnamed protein product [Ectocarpus sp. 8 AP-2014]